MRRIATQLRLVGQTAQVRPALASGLRAALTTVIPLIVGQQLHQPLVAWTSLGGFLTSVADKGGSYRTRAAVTGALTLFSTVAAIVGALAGAHTWASVLLMCLFGVGCGLARVYGAEAGTVGSLTAVTFAVSLASPISHGSPAIVRGAYVLLGGLWAMLLSLVLWPVRYYRPAREAVARCFELLAEYSAELERLSTAPASDWPKLARERHPRLRDALELTRATLAATRRGRQGESGRGEQLLLILEGADRLFATLVATGDELDQLDRDPAFADAREDLAHVLWSIAATARELASGVRSEVALPPIKLDWSSDGLRTTLDRMSGAPAMAQYVYAAELIDRLRATAADIAEAVQALHAGVPRTHLQHITRPPSAHWSTWVLAPLLANLDPGSIVLRHALRVGVVASVAVLINHVFHLAHGYWATLAVIVILQPYTGATTVKGLQRVVGTVIGGVITALLAAHFHQPREVLVLVFVLSFIAVALLPLNYAVYSMVLTPTFVLLAELRAGDWHLVGARIGNTVLGSALALVGGWLLWPSPERIRFPAHMATAVDAISAYAGATIRQLLAAGDRGLPEVRRRAGLELLNAETSFQRLLSENPLQPDGSEQLMALLTELRRLASGITALGAISVRVENEPQRECLVHIEALIRETLGEVKQVVLRPTDAVHTAEPIADSACIAHPILRAQLDRVVRLLRELHATALRSSGVLPAERAEA